MKLCPACDGIADVLFASNRFAIWCLHCGLRGPVCETSLDAVDAWDKLPRRNKGDGQPRYGGIATPDFPCVLSTTEPTVHDRAWDVLVGLASLIRTEPYTEAVDLVDSAYVIAEAYMAEKARREVGTK